MYMCRGGRAGAQGEEGGIVFSNDSSILAQPNVGVFPGFHVALDHSIIFNGVFSDPSTGP